MKKIILILVVGLTTTMCNAQQYHSLNTQYKAPTFEEQARPYLMYAEAYNRNSQIFADYMEKLYISINTDSPNWYLVKFYSNKCIEINNSRMFNGELYDNGELYFIRGISEICLGQKSEGINDLWRAYHYGYNTAKEIIDELEKQ